MQKGEQIYQLDSTMSLKEFNDKMAEGKTFPAPYSDYLINRIDPREIVLFREQELAEGISPIFQY